MERGSETSIRKMICKKNKEVDRRGKKCCGRTDVELEMEI